MWTKHLLLYTNMKYWRQIKKKKKKPCFDAICMSWLFQMVTFCRQMLSWWPFVFICLTNSQELTCIIEGVKTILLQLFSFKVTLQKKFNSLHRWVIWNYFPWWISQCYSATTSTKATQENFLQTSQWESHIGTMDFHKINFVWQIYPLSKHNKNSNCGYSVVSSLEHYWPICKKKFLGGLGRSSCTVIILLSHKSF